MTDEEFTRYCAEVMGYKWGVWAVSIMPGNNETWEGYKDSEGYEVNMHAAGDLNQMAEVFDKLVSKTVVNCHIPDAPENLLFSQLSISMVTEGIAQAMREFIESTGEI